MDKDGYPTKTELKIIREWSFLDPLGLIEFIRQRWNFAKVGYFNLKIGKVSKLELHTAGWSGNESIIGALMGNDMFWVLFWQKSERGGHYYFDDSMIAQQDRWKAKRAQQKQKSENLTAK